MSRPAVQPLESPTLGQPSSEASNAVPLPVRPLRTLRTRLQDASQIAILFLYLIAAMTPQVRRALSALDRV